MKTKKSAIWVVAVVLAVAVVGAAVYFGNTNLQQGFLKIKLNTNKALDILIEDVRGRGKDANGDYLVNVIVRALGCRGIFSTSLSAVLIGPPYNEPIPEDQIVITDPAKERIRSCNSIYTVPFRISATNHVGRYRYIEINAKADSLNENSEFNEGNNVFSGTFDITNSGFIRLGLSGNIQNEINSEINLVISGKRNQNRS